MRNSEPATERAQTIKTNITVKFGGGKQAKGGKDDSEPKDQQ